MILVSKLEGNALAVELAMSALVDGVRVIVDTTGRTRVAKGMQRGMLGETVNGESAVCMQGTGWSVVLLVPVRLRREARVADRRRDDDVILDAGVSVGAVVGSTHRH